MTQQARQLLGWGLLGGGGGGGGGSGGRACGGWKSCFSLRFRRGFSSPHPSPLPTDAGRGSIFETASSQEFRFICRAITRNGVRRRSPCLRSASRPSYGRLRRAPV